MRELEKYQKTEAYKHFTRKVQEKQKGKRHRGGEARPWAYQILQATHDQVDVKIAVDRLNAFFFFFFTYW